MAWQRRGGAGGEEEEPWGEGGVAAHAQRGGGVAEAAGRSGAEGTQSTTDWEGLHASDSLVGFRGNLRHQILLITIMVSGG